MTRLIILIYGLSLFQFLSAQELICPPNETRFCYEDLITQPQIIDSAGFNLQAAQEFSGTTCSVFNVTNIFSLVDLEKDSIVATCQQRITIQPFSEAIRFPQDTVVRGYTVSEVYNESVFTDGLFPLAVNDCNVIFHFQDVIVEVFPELYIFRDWEAENLCTGQTSVSRQRILLLDIPNDAIATDIEDCVGQEIIVDGFAIYINDQPWVRDLCYKPYLEMYEMLNCIADTLLVEPTDKLRLEINDITNPYLGVSSLDLKDIQRHILGLKRFESDCRLRAADVNRDGRINGIDLVEARKLMLGIYTQWPYGDGPDYYINGELRDNLELTKEDFPLTALKITVANQANTSTN